MDIKEVIRSRRSIRRYEDKPIPPDKLEAVFDMARLAPSARNLQPWEFIVVQDKSTRKGIAEGCRYGSFLSECPAIIIGCGDVQLSPKWASSDTVIAMEHIALAAIEEGLGTCWIGAFDENEIRGLLRIPENLKVIALMAIGFPDERPKPRSRKTLAEFVSYGKWGDRNQEE